MKRIYLLFLLLLPSIISAQDFWQQINSPGGIWSIAIDMDGHILVARKGGLSPGLYRSTDLGSSWTNVSPPGVTYGFGVVTISATGLMFAAADFWEGVYRSTDDGITWTQVGLTNALDIFVLTTVPPSYVFAGTSTMGLCRSTDNGNTWATIDSGLTGVYVQSLAFKSTGVLFAGCGVGVGGTASIYRSTDLGESWTLMGLTGLVITSLSIAPNGYIFAGHPFQTGAYRSVDNGSTWSWVGYPQISLHSIVVNRSGLVFEGASGQNDPPNLGGVFSSTDYGGTWTPLVSGLTDREVNCLAIDSSGFLYAATYNGHLFRSVGPTTSVARIPSELIEGHILSQNYPNPFNPSTTINYEITTRCQVVLRVFDVLGREVANLVNDIQEPGYKSVQWDASSFTSGLYFYQLRAGSFIETRKMLLVK